MGMLSGAMSVSRFRVVGEVRGEGWRDDFRDRLDEFAFKEPPHDVGKEEVEGWVQVHNLLDADFSDFNRWLYNEYALFALRVDKKRLPAKLFKATLDKKCDAWKAERDLERIPASVRTDLKDALEAEWLRRTLPSVGFTEAVWNIDAGWLIVHSMSESVLERFRVRFFRTFGKRLLPWSPLDHLDDPEIVDQLLAKAPSAVMPEVTRDV